MKIYIVEGSTGEYSDHNEWIVAAYRKEEDAKELVEKASARARELFACRDEWQYRSEDKKYQNEFDPFMNMDYTGTNYAYCETELR